MARRDRDACEQETGWKVLCQSPVTNLAVCGLILSGVKDPCESLFVRWLPEKGKKSMSRPKPETLKIAGLGRKSKGIEETLPGADNYLGSLGTLAERSAGPPP